MPLASLIVPVPAAVKATVPLALVVVMLPLMTTEPAREAKPVLLTVTEFVAVISPLSAMPAPVVVNLTALPTTASNEVAPAEANVTAPVEVRAEPTATGPALLSLRLIS